MDALPCFALRAMLFLHSFTPGASALDYALGSSTSTLALQLAVDAPSSAPLSPPAVIAPYTRLVLPTLVRALLAADATPARQVHPPLSLPHAVLLDGPDVVLTVAALRTGAPAVDPDEQGHTALHFAVVRRNLAAVKLLTAVSANVNCKNYNGEPPCSIVLAAWAEAPEQPLAKYSADLELLKALAGARNASVDASASDGVTMLEGVVRYTTDTSFAEQLLGRGAAKAGADKWVAARWQFAASGGAGGLTGAMEMTRLLALSGAPLGPGALSAALRAMADAPAVNLDASAAATAAPAASPTALTPVQLAQLFDHVVMVLAETGQCLARDIKTTAAAINSCESGDVLSR
jgi:hypothetical protein